MIYVIESGDYFKVGFSKNPEKRLAAYRTHNPDIRGIAQYTGDKILEKIVHRKLRKYKVRGEWFVKFDGWCKGVEDIITRHGGQRCVRLVSAKPAPVTEHVVSEFFKSQDSELICRLNEFSHPKSRLLFKKGLGILSMAVVADLVGMSHNEFRDAVNRLKGILIEHKDPLSEDVYLSIHDSFATYACKDD